MLLFASVFDYFIALYTGTGTATATATEATADWKTADDCELAADQDLSPPAKKSRVSAVGIDDELSDLFQLPPGMNYSIQVTLLIML